MKTLKENFGRRMALIWGGIVAVLISLVMVAAFSVQAKAADPNRVDADPYSPNQNSLTALVHAGAADAFSATFDYTVSKVSFGKSTDPAELAKMPALTYFPSGATPTDNHIQLNLAVDATGTASSTDPNATVADTLGVSRREGPGSRTTTEISPEQQFAENGEPAGSEYWTWETDIEKCYFVQLPFSYVVAGKTWDYPGEYRYKITDEAVASEQNIPASDAEYDLRIYVETNTTSGENEVVGYILSQYKHDTGDTMYIDKKDPRRGFGNSNHLESYTPDPEKEETATHYYYGFTYSHAITGEPQPFYVQKGIVHTDGTTETEEDYPDRIDFPMTLCFYNSTYTGASTEKPVGVICDVPYNNWQADDATKTPIAAVTTFVWGPDAAGDNCWSASFNLKHAQRIVFDGATAFSGTTSTKIPAMTAYTCKEDMESDTTGAFAHYTAKATAYTQAQATGQAQQWTPSGGTSTDTKGTAKNMFVTFWEWDVEGTTAGTWANNSQAYVSANASASQVNKTVIRNIYDENPTNFWLDILPYVVMIGIPIAAFVIWMLARRKKFNR